MDEHRATASRPPAQRWVLQESQRRDHRCQQIQRSLDTAKQKCSLCRTIILITWGELRAVWGNSYPYFYQEEQLASAGLQAGINVFFPHCLELFIKPQPHFCQHGVRTSLHSLVVFVRAAQSLQQRHTWSKIMEIHGFAWHEAGRGDDTVWLDLFTAGCDCTVKDRPAYVPSNIHVSSHPPGLGCKKTLAESRLKRG